MIFTPTAIKGAFVIDLEPRDDHRGSFARAFCRRELGAAGIDFDVVQCNLAHTRHAGVIRGLHFQRAPAREQKFVRCVRGAVFDALVDMRPASPSYGEAIWVHLDAVRHRALFVPSGVAHGFQSLTDHTEVLYMTDHYHVPGLEAGVRFDDPAFSIPWPLAPRDLSERDLQWALLPQTA
jgi:dTDP-4-dehydrorhamnose 3,5-epimerase